MLFLFLSTLMRERPIETLGYYMNRNFVKILVIATRQFHKKVIFGNYNLWGKFKNISFKVILQVRSFKSRIQINYGVLLVGEGW